jgi:nucleoside-diphosphate-sugar epimerase
MKFTVLGSTGFVGSNLCNYLQKNGISYFSPDRNFEFKKSQNLGHIIYCIGLTADFRTRPVETVQAHVCKLIEVLENSIFDSFVYLSSTRVYMNARETNESSNLLVNPNNFSDLYNLSKLMGESVCLSYKNDAIKVARLSNVIGNDLKSDNFVFSLLQEIGLTKRLTLNTSLNSAKDYISIEDVVKLLYQISVHGKHRLYNIASGKNVSNKEILDQISESAIFETLVTNPSLDIIFPQIDTSLIKNEFRFFPADVMIKINELTHSFLKETNYDKN